MIFTVSALTCPKYVTTHAWCKSWQFWIHFHILWRICGTRTALFVSQEDAHSVQRSQRGSGWLLSQEQVKFNACHGKCWWWDSLLSCPREEQGKEKFRLNFHMAALSTGWDLGCFKWSLLPVVLLRKQRAMPWNASLGFWQVQSLTVSAPALQWGCPATPSLDHSWCFS